MTLCLPRKNRTPVLSIIMICQSANQPIRCHSLCLLTIHAIFTPWSCGMNIICGICFPQLHAPLHGRYTNMPNDRTTRPFRMHLISPIIIAHNDQPGNGTLALGSRHRENVGSTEWNLFQFKTWCKLASERTPVRPVPPPPSQPTTTRMMRRCRRR